MHHNSPYKLMPHPSLGTNNHCPNFKNSIPLNNPIFNPMKPNRLILPTLLAFALLIAACKEDDPIDQNPPPSTPETSLSVTCIDTGNRGISGIFVGIASQTADCNAGVFLKSDITDNFGKIKFTNLDPQTFCYEARRTVTGGVVKKTGTVEILQDEQKRITLTF